MRLSGKVALVFGAGSVGDELGNGQACAIAYAREGAQVVAVDLNPEAAAATVSMITAEGGSAVASQADIRNPEQVARCVEDVLNARGQIDILHNNVGAPVPGGILESDEATFELAMEINLKGAYRACRAVLPHMEARARGAIINISSMASLRWNGYPYVGYSVGKAALNKLTQSIAMEFSDKGIRANAILPGKISTPHMHQNISGYYGSQEEMMAKRAAAVPMGRMGTAWDIAGAAVFLASDDSAFITGVILPVDGGAHCCGP